MNLARWLERSARGAPNRAAIAEGSSVAATYEEMAERAAGLAGSLRNQLGLEPGDRVVIAAKNHPAYLEALFAAWWAGLVAVPVNAKLHASEIGWILEHSGASVAFVSADLEPAVGGLDLPSTRAIVGLGSQEYARLASAEPMGIAERAPRDPAWLFYTSGTTGRPKGAILSHRNLAAMSLAYLAEVDPTKSSDALLHAAPMSHGSGLYAIPHILRGALNIIPESGGFDADEVLKTMESRRGTSMFAAPTMVRRMTERYTDVDPARIRTIIWGGAPMHVTDVERAADRFPGALAQIYGQGETPMTITVLSKSVVADRDNPEWSQRMQSAGRSNPAVEVEVADPDGQLLPAGNSGEVSVRGDTVMSGYWNDPEASAKALQDGWLRTGDIGVIDKAGFLTLKDRRNDLIISGGTNVYPREVEDVLISHPRVIEASVIGRSDPEWGEVVVAYVVGETTADELDQLCLSRIARFKRPKEYRFVSELPKNNYGKVLKTELRERDRQ